MLKTLKTKIKNKLIDIIKSVQNNKLIDNLNTQVMQTELFMHYQMLQKLNLSLPEFSDTGFRVYSQNDEDGLLLYIFSLIGFTNKICIDIAFGSPHNSNTTNLLCNWGFYGLLVEGSPLAETKKFFESHPDTYIYPPKLLNAWITAENINSLIEDNGIKGEIDLFSLDVDGIDYYLWKALTVVHPRVIILEYQDIWGDSYAKTVPYKPDFNRFDIHPDFFGASLPAFIKLGQEKGYRLIGCNKYSFNAFFLRNDLGINIFPEVTPKKCLKHPKVLEGQRSRLPIVKNLPWVDV